MAISRVAAIGPSSHKKISGAEDLRHRSTKHCPVLFSGMKEVQQRIPPGFQQEKHDSCPEKHQKAECLHQLKYTSANSKSSGRAASVPANSGSSMLRAASSSACHAVKHVVDTGKVPPCIRAQCHRMVQLAV